jgi:hypothetical protein
MCDDQPVMKVIDFWVAKAIRAHALTNNPAPLLSDLLPGPGVTGAIVLVGFLLCLCSSTRWNRSQQTLVQPCDNTQAS